MAIFRGAGVAIVTPFNEDGSVNFDNYGELIEWQIAEGTDAIISCGTTGEASTMTDEEQIEVISYCVDKVKGRVPVIAGAGSNDTKHGVNLSVEAEKAGADALLQVTPYYNKATQKGLIQHYNAIADSVNIPIILYSVQGRTGVNIKPSTVVELAKHPNITAIKEASGNISQCAGAGRFLYLFRKRRYDHAASGAGRRRSHLRTLQYRSETDARNRTEVLRRRHRRSDQWTAKSETDDRRALCRSQSDPGQSRSGHHGPLQDEFPPSALRSGRIHDGTS